MIPTVYAAFAHIRPHGFGHFLYQELKLDQKTPLRVLHRRPLAVRCRLIHTMKSEYIDEHHFRLHLKTQAGTYPWVP